MTLSEYEQYWQDQQAAWSVPEHTFALLLKFRL